MDERRHLINEYEAADFLKVKVSSMRNWRWKGEGPPYYRISSRLIRYDMAELENFIKEKSVNPVA
jgi:hypothetical protein